MRSHPGSRRVLGMLLAVLAIWFAATVAVGLPPKAHFLIYGLAGGALIVLTAYPGRTTGGLLVTGACLLLLFHVGPPLHRAMAVEPGFPLAYLGLAGIIYLAVRSLRGTVPRPVLVGAVGIPVAIFLMEPFHAAVIAATPKTLDPVLHRLDVAIFGDLTFASARLLARHSWLSVAANWCYAALALVGAGVYALALRGRTGKVSPAELLWTWAIAGVIGALVYPLVPAVGPRWAFPEWPWAMPETAATHIVPLAAVPRNAMPSLHASWALLVYWGAREAPTIVRYLLAPWLALILLATLAAGGHYLIDLVAALPLTWAAARIGARAVRLDFGRIMVKPSGETTAPAVPQHP